MKVQSGLEVTLPGVKGVYVRLFSPAIDLGTDHLNEPVKRPCDPLILPISRLISLLLFFFSCMVL